MMRTSNRLCRAFTLVELLIAIAVVAIVLTLAAPSFREFILMQRLKSVHAHLVTDLQFARSEAISRGQEVNFRVQPAPDPSSGSTAPSCYIVFSDTSRNYSQLGASSNCNCREAEGSRCTAAGTTEIRTVQIPVSLEIFLKLPSVRQSVAFDPVTGGMVMVLSELGVGTGNEFTIYSEIDAARKLAAVVGLSGRPTICRPAGSSMDEAGC